MKKVVIGLVILLLLCCCCSAIIGLGLLFTSSSGYVEFNGQCLHKGADANPTTGPCATFIAPATPGSNPTPTPNPQPTSNGLVKYTGRHSDEFVFSYPKTYVLDDSDSETTYVYRKDPSLNVQGDFNDNLNITSADIAMNVTQDNCDYYAQQLIDNVGASLNINQSSVATDIQTINNLKVCIVSWDAKITGIDFTQSQFVFSDTKKDKNYIVTVSLKQDSENTGTFADIVDSFESK